jgi:hypothetical protein
MGSVPRFFRLLAACLAGSAAWAVSEVSGGLAFLAAGVRLWRYQILPLFSRAFRTDRLSPRRRAAARLGFMMCMGPVLEVLINRHVFIRLFGEPLYLYTVLPTFHGSGSILSPLYYATLYIHVPVADRLLGSARYARRSARSEMASMSTSREASMSSAA